jgi:hypothetical protein
MLLATVAVKLHVPTGQHPVIGRLVSGSIGRPGVPGVNVPLIAKLALHSSALLTGGGCGGGGGIIIIGSSPPTPQPAAATMARRRLAPANRVMPHRNATRAPAPNPADSHASTS